MFGNLAKQVTDLYGRVGLNQLKLAELKVSLDAHAEGLQKCSELLGCLREKLDDLSGRMAHLERKK